MCALNSCVSLRAYRTNQLLQNLESRVILYFHAVFIGPEGAPLRIVSHVEQVQAFFSNEGPQAKRHPVADVHIVHKAGVRRFQDEAVRALNGRIVRAQDRRQRLPQRPAPDHDLAPEDGGLDDVRRAVRRGDGGGSYVPQTY